MIMTINEGSFSVILITSDSGCQGSPFPEKMAVFFEDVEALILGSDVVFICTNTPNHFKYALICLENNKHVFIEKPMTLSSKEAEGLVSIAEDNDSILMVDFINRYRSEGNSIKDAVLEAGPRRFRPIFLTSLTTFVGLIPLILEKSTQAKFMIPMAVSLSFGVLFATAITLLLVPVSYLTLEKYILKTEDK